MLSDDGAQEEQKRPLHDGQCFPSVMSRLWQVPSRVCYSRRSAAESAEATQSILMHPSASKGLRYATKHFLNYFNRGCMSTDRKRK